jgi:organic radical activating enzyme
VSKACDLKLNQKVFYLQFDRAASCCRAQPQDLNKITFPDLIQKWSTEKTDLAQGQEIIGCEYCWRDEQQGRSSYRQLNSGTDIHMIELYVSNNCNHMCSYCSPKFSSKWQHSIHTQGMFQNISATNQHNLSLAQSGDTTSWLEHIRDYIQQQPDDSVVLKLLGGEPLMQIRNLGLLLRMDSAKIRQLKLVTNLAPPSNRFLRWLLDHVPASKLHISISLDSNPSYNHIPRSGFDADRFNINLNLLRTYGVPHDILSVISVLSVFDLPQFMTWLDQTGISNQFNRLYNPDCLDAALLPRWIRQMIWDQIEHDSTVLREVLNSETEPIDIKRFEQYNYLTQYFQRSQQDPKKINNDLFQEYWTWLQGTYQK